MKVCMLRDAQHVEEVCSLSLESKVNESKATVKFQLNKVLYKGVRVLLWGTVAWMRSKSSRMFRSVLIPWSHFWKRTGKMFQVHAYLKSTLASIIEYFELVFSSVV
ncbi:hypothetical protein HHK36_027458 [Tetracentron sinense]|uniref:Uncharacterized protein n=1 Tax=Tetracentron sinense TaxID=13715 RepID=A0A835D1L0_TETSI|nr:hypothetical protein HHK36_027458 [Tetracentron sinense]